MSPPSRPRLQEGTPAHDRWSAATVLAVGTVALLAGIDRLWSDAPGEVAVGWQLALLACGCGLLLLKRRWPVPVLLAVSGVAAVDLWSGQQLGVLLVFIDAVYSVARFGSERTSRSLGYVVATVVVVATVGLYVGTADHRTALLVGLQAFAVLGTPYWWATAVRRAAEAADLAERRAEDAHRLAEARRSEALRRERARTAGDVHDALSGHLSAIAIHAEAGLGAPAAAPAALRTVRDSGRAALKDLQTLVLLLRDDTDPAATPRMSDLDTLVSQARERGADVRWQPVELGPLPEVVDRAGYRIVQESLTNAGRHAPGRPVELVAHVEAGALHLSVTNPTTAGGDGHPEGAGVGVASMTDRARSLGGRLDAGVEATAAGADQWAVRAVLPLDGERR